MRQYNVVRAKTDKSAQAKPKTTYKHAFFFYIVFRLCCSSFKQSAP